MTCLVKAMVFPVVMYGCESWTVKKAERQRIDAFELWCWRRLLSTYIFHIILQFRLLHDIKCSSLCYMVNSVGLVVSFEIRNCEFFDFILFHNCFDYSIFLKNFRIDFSVSAKISCDFDRSWKESVDHFE